MNLYVVQYRDRFGRPARSAAMPIDVAQQYARTVANPSIVAVEAVAATVNMTVLPPGTARDVRESARRYYKHAPPPWATAAGRRALREMYDLLDTADRREERAAKQATE